MRVIQRIDDRLITRPISKRLDYFYHSSALASHYILNGSHGGIFRKSLADWIKRLRKFPSPSLFIKNYDSIQKEAFIDESEDCSKE